MYINKYKYEKIYIYLSIYIYILRCGKDIAASRTHAMPTYGRNLGLTNLYISISIYLSIYIYIYISIYNYIYIEVEQRHCGGQNHIYISGVNPIYIYQSIYIYLSICLYRGGAKTSRRAEPTRCQLKAGTDWG